MRFQIFGERCSGTNYLEHLLKYNFGDDSVTWQFGHKHWYIDHDRIKNTPSSQDTIFIAIIRDLRDWIRSFFAHPHHLDRRARNIRQFLTQPIVSMVTPPEYQKDIFELRASKLNDLFQLRNSAPHVLYVRYEYLRDHPEEWITALSQKYNLPLVHPNVEPVLTYKGYGEKPYRPSQYEGFKSIDEDYILAHTDWATEALVDGYATKYDSGSNTIRDRGFVSAK